MVDDISEGNVLVKSYFQIITVVGSGPFKLGLLETPLTSSKTILGNNRPERSDDQATQLDETLKRSHLSLPKPNPNSLPTCF